MARNAEAKVQAAIVTYLRTVAPQCVTFAVPNGGLRTRAEAALMKWTGTLAGTPDLVLIAPGGRAYFLEVKTAEGRLSAAQSETIWALRKLGCPCAIVRSIDDVRAALLHWHIPTREQAQEKAA